MQPQRLRVHYLPVSLPVADVFKDNPGRGLGGVLAADALDEVTFGVHDVEVDAVVD